jgi:hypothetical protein
MNSKYTYDNKSLLRNGERWFPVMGEIHYSRIPNQYWKEALLKMKAGGVDIISSYVIWIHHEEIENEWDFTGQRNLRSFVQLVHDCGMTMVLRIGPWCHGEVRNGGFPDWLLHKEFKARTNDERYFAEVEKFYKKIYAEIKGLLLKDGGPIIGVQIENEFGHCGGLWGSEGEAHMKRLYETARKVGFVVPLYTATGWGGAVTAGLLPVMGGYCDAPWDPRTTEIEPSGNYVFTYERNDHAIGSDYGLGEGITFDMKKVPYLTAELGGGLQVTYRRRPVTTAADIGAMSLVKLGSGVNLLGYYMYHGGTNPEGKKTTLEENCATGYPNDLPVLSYDFRAPVGEYGETTPTFKELKLYSLFLHEWGTQLCNMAAHIPEDNPLMPDDVKHMRLSWRYEIEDSSTNDLPADKAIASKKCRGFLFVNNYVRRQTLAQHNNVIFFGPPLTEQENAAHELQKVFFPPVTLRNGDYFFLPFNMAVGSNTLVSSLATPLCVLHNRRQAYVFYKSATASEEDSHSGTDALPAITPVSNASESLYQFEGTVSDDCDIITLTRNDALNASKLCTPSVQGNEKEYLALSDGTFTESDRDGTYNLYAKGVPSFKIWPPLERTPAHFTCKDEITPEKFSVYEYKETIPEAPAVTCVPVSFSEALATYRIAVDEWPCDDEGILNDMTLHVAYTGNAARLYEDGKLIADNLYIGPKYDWQIGLRRFGNKFHSFILEIDALSKEKPLYLEEWPPLQNGRALSLLTVNAEVSLKVSVCL